MHLEKNSKHSVLSYRFRNYSSSFLFSETAMANINSGILMSPEYQSAEVEAVGDFFRMDPETDII